MCKLKRIPPVASRTYSNYLNSLALPIHVNYPKDQGVVGLDISLSNLSQRLATYAHRFTGEAYLIKNNGELIAQYNKIHPKTTLQKITPLRLTAVEQQSISQLGTLTISNVSDWQPIDFALSGMPKGYGVDVLKLIAEKLGLKIDFINGYVWADFVKQFRKNDLALLNGVFDNQENRNLGLLSDPYGNLPLGLVVKGQDKQYSSLRDLHGKTLAIGEGWSVIELIRQAHPQINIVTLDSVQALLNGLIDGEVDAVLDSPIILDKSLKEFSVQGLSVIHDFSFSDIELDTRLRVLLQQEHHALLPLFNRAIAELQLTHIPQLQQKWLKSNNENATERVLPYIKNIQQISNENIDTLVHIEHQHTNKLIYMSQLDSSLTQNQFLVLAIDEEKLFESVYESVTKSSLITLIVITIVLIPLTYLCASPLVETINTLLIQTQHMARRDYSSVKISSTSVIEIKRLSIAIKKASLSLKRHEIAQRNLIDSMIQLIAQAIDQKSPYTGAHCNRVPVLGEMLLTAANNSKTGIFSGFEFHTEKDWREFKTAAWLHDCGKITTPEHIVDKGSKLECIYNRIHEIRMRFEVLHRDAEISCLMALQQTPDKHQELYAKRDARQQQLQEYFSFIAKANIGSEFMSDEIQQKIHKFAKQIWIRHFDDRLGLSPAEERELPAKDRSLPAFEYLLEDKQDHITHRVLPYELPDKLGIKMQVPKLVSNQGEIYNLCISRGTLTAEDRFTINEHIIATIKILDQVPFPPELANVPRLASTHHETMRGDGYPRKLQGSQLSIPERILALADIFEALTASDRPYKNAKPLSVALDILHKMAKEQHIDINIFHLFIESEIYLEYAQKFLPESQINAIDKSRYLT